MATGLKIAIVSYKLFNLLNDDSMLGTALRMAFVEDIKPITKSPDGIIVIDFRENNGKFSLNSLYLLVSVRYEFFLKWLEDANCQIKTC